MLKIPFNTGLLDSLTIYLNIKDITVIDYKLVETFKPFYESTGELLEDVEINPRPVIIQKDGVNFRFNRVVYPPNANQPEPQELIRLTLTSKMLFENYFTGINKNNIISIFDFVRSQKIIDFSNEVGLNALCNDIDICINYRLEFEAYKIAIYYFKKMVLDTKQQRVTVISPKKAESLSKNFGLMFGDRNKGSVTNPFIKYYNKTDELLTNSKDFYTKYIEPMTKKGLDISNVIRKEITIKNSSFKRSLLKKKQVHPENSLRTLNDILDINTNQLTYICNYQLKHYFHKREFTVNADLSPTEKIIAYYMNKLIELGVDKTEIYAPLTLFDISKEKVQKSRSKKLIDNVLSTVLDDDYIENLLSKNKSANEFIKMQNIW